MWRNHCICDVLLLLTLSTLWSAVLVASYTTTLPYNLTEFDSAFVLDNLIIRQPTNSTTPVYNGIQASEETGEKPDVTSESEEYSNNGREIIKEERVTETPPVRNQNLTRQSIRAQQIKDAQKAVAEKRALEVAEQKRKLVIIEKIRQDRLAVAQAATDARVAARSVKLAEVKQRAEERQKEVAVKAKERDDKRQLLQKLRTSIGQSCSTNSDCNGGCCAISVTLRSIQPVCHEPNRTRLAEKCITSCTCQPALKCFISNRNLEKAQARNSTALGECTPPNSRRRLLGTFTGDELGSTL